MFPDPTAIQKLAETRVKIASNVSAVKMDDNMAETRQDGGLIACDTVNSCPAPFECSSKFGVCLCPIGYYNDGSNNCLAGE